MLCARYHYSVVVLFGLEVETPLWPAFTLVLTFMIVLLKFALTY